MKLFKLIFSISILFPIALIAQTDSIQKKNFWLNKNIILGYQNGYVFQTNDFLRGRNAQATNLDEYQDFFFKISKQTNGKKRWEQIYNYPEWGFGAYMADFYNPREIGTPIALFGFLNAPFVRWDKGAFNYELSFGATSNWKSFNPVTNQYNNAIGAGQSFFINAGLNLDFELTKNLDLVTGFSLTHFSNGALKIPNSVINSIDPKVSLRYNLYEKPEIIKQKLPKFDAHNEWEFSTFFGAKNLVFVDSVSTDIIQQYEGLLYPVFGFTTCFNRQVSRKSKIGLGINFIYNSTVNAEEVGKLAVSTND